MILSEAAAVEVGADDDDDGVVSAMSWGSSSSESGSSPQRVAGAMVAVVLSICGKRELRGVSSTSAEARLCLWL